MVLTESAVKEDEITQRIAEYSMTFHRTGGKDADWMVRALLELKQRRAEDRAAKN